MHIHYGDIHDFEAAYQYIRQLWDYNTYDRETVYELYTRELQNPDSFLIFPEDEQGRFHGFCHGCFLTTFWLSGPTCYISGIITNPEDRGRGYGKMLLDAVQALSRERGCRGMILDSGLPRTAAHGFYEHYGFTKSCYGFDYLL